MAGSEKRILIVGTSGFVGRHLYAELGQDRAIGTYHRNALPNLVYFDALAMDLQELMADPALISCAVLLLGDTKPNSCALNPVESKALNVNAIKKILDRLADWKIKPVFTSSEVVFSGEHGNYIESDIPTSILKYGQQKLEIETYIKEKFENYLILRLGTVLGVNQGDGTLLTSWSESIATGAECLCATDFINTPVFIDDVVKSITGLIANDSSGIFHVSSEYPVSRLELHKILLDEMKVYKTLDGAEGIPCSIHDFDLPEKRPLNVSMRPNKLKDELAISMTPVKDLCSTIAGTVLQSASHQGTES